MTEGADTQEPKVILSSARLKVNWAHAHILDLDRAIRDYAAPENHAARIECDPETLANKAFLESQPVPDSFALSFGDIVHILRSSLDHAIHQIVVDKIGNKNRRDTKFPFHKTRANVKRGGRGISDH